MEDTIKKRIKDLKQWKPEYARILEDPRFRMIPTIDLTAIELLKKAGIQNILELALVEVDSILEILFATKNYILIIEEWIQLPGNLATFRDIWDENQPEEEDLLEELKFPQECTECHKRIDESDDWQFRIDNSLICKVCREFYTECSSCEKIFQPEYLPNSLEPELCPNCNNIEVSFATYLLKIAPEEKANIIVESWIKEAQDAILHQNMLSYLVSTILPRKNK
jgi:hypothetical protein